MTEWVTIEMPTDSDRSLAPIPKVQPPRTDREERQQVQNERIAMEEEARRWAYHFGAVAAEQGQQLANSSIQHVQATTQREALAIFGPIGQALALGGLALGTLAIHAGVTFVRPILNVNNVLTPWGLAGLARSLAGQSGNALAQSFDPTPLKKGDRVGQWLITSGFGPRVAPTPGASTFHPGVDLNTPTGTPIYAPENGRIECKEQANGYGLYADAQWGMAGHLSECNPGRYAAGQQFGATGASGIGTGPHADFRQRRGGEFVPPDRGFVSTLLGIDSPAPTRAASASPEKEQQAIAFFLAQGFTPTAVAHMVGSLIQESGLNPAAVGDNGTAFGLNQWRGDRRRGMPNDFQGQLEHVILDMQRDDGSAGVLKTMRSSSNAAEIRAALKRHTRWGHLGNRWVHADRILKGIREAGVSEVAPVVEVESNVLQRAEGRI